MSDYFQIPVAKRGDGYTVILDEDIVEKLNLGPDCKNIFVQYTEKGLEIQKMVNVDLDLDESALRVLERAAKEQDMSIQELVIKSLEKILDK